MVTIEASERNWRRLNRHKNPGDSFDAVLSDALDALEATDQGEES